MRREERVECAPGMPTRPPLRRRTRLCLRLSHRPNSFTTQLRVCSARCASEASPGRSATHKPTEFTAQHGAGPHLLDSFLGLLINKSGANRHGGVRRAG